MTYRAKLLTLLTCLVVISNGLLASANYVESKSMLEMEIHRKTRSIAATAAALLDPEIVKTIRHRADENTPAYARLQGELRKVRDINQRNDTWVQRIFILIPAEQPRVVGMQSMLRSVSNTNTIRAISICAAASRSISVSRGSTSLPNS